MDDDRWVHLRLLLPYRWELPAEVRYVISYIYHAYIIYLSHVLPSFLPSPTGVDDGTRTHSRIPLAHFHWLQNRLKNNENTKYTPGMYVCTPPGTKCYGTAAVPVREGTVHIMPTPELLMNIYKN